MRLDLELISGNFLYDDSVPKEKEFYFKYFTKELQRRFLVYWVNFEEFYQGCTYAYIHRNFVDHTGMICSNSNFNKNLNLYKKLTKELKTMRQEGDIEKVSKIVSGQSDFKREQ